MGVVFRNRPSGDANHALGPRGWEGRRDGVMGRLVRVFSPKRWLGCTAPRAQQLDFSACVDFMESQKIMPVAVVGDEPEEGAGGDPAVDIKCIAFRLKTCPSVPAVIVVIDQRRRVDLKKVAGCLERELGSEVSIRRQDVAMVDRDRLVETVGFPVGEVPPFGFPRDDMVRIVDEQLVEDGMLVRFGPGDGDVVIRGRDLLVGGGIAADVCERIDERRSGEDDGLHSIGTGLENTEPYEFETVMRVVRKRKLAKRLLFATVVPALHGGRHHAYSRHVRSPGGSLVWRHPETEKACELQLIVGKTVERRYGPKVMEQKILKRILKGGYVRVVGKVQANPKNDACVDVVVHDLETFGTSLIGVEDGTQGGRLGVTSASSMPEPLEKRPTQQPYVNLNTLKMKKKKKQGITEEDLLPEYAPARESSITMVTTMDDLRRLEDAVRRATAISLDAEWRPSTRQGSSNPVSLLQIGVAGSDKTTMGVFLIDMLELCFYCHDGSFDRELSDEQVVLSDILEALFGSETPKLGFGLRYDVKRLRESYPWLPCFRGNAPIISHVDVGMLGRLAGKVKAHKNLSLSKLTSAVLNMRLSKEEQMSDWGHRPLDERQIAYASNDVACLIDIFDALSSAEPGILSGRRSMDYVSLGLTELGTSNRGHAMGSGDGWYSGPEDNNDRLMNDPAAWELERRPRQPQKLPLKSCTCDPSLARDFLGEYVDRGGKEGAVTALIGREEAKKYNQVKRGGAIVEMANAFLFFVNIPSRNYPNEFTPDGKMSWFSGRGQTLDHPVIKRILDGEKHLTLWCRREKERYVYFGEMAVDSVIEQADGTLKVWFQLKEWTTVGTNPTVMHVLAGNSNV